MRDFRDAKAMAQTLREALKTKSVSLTHSESLELVATILGFHDWNVLSATIQSEVQPAANPGSTIPADSQAGSGKSAADRAAAGHRGLPAPERSAVRRPRQDHPRG